MPHESLESSVGPASLASASGRAAPPVPGFAVVELFTSEGCSSCPAADATLARIATNAERSGLPVFTVELHVDYWDYLGWRDPFDDSRFSRRQAVYGRLSRSKYTPQAVVNGLEEAVGSDEARLIELVSRALATRATTRLTLSAERKDGGLVVRCQGDGGLEPTQVLNLFVLESHAESSVAHGENAGEHLTHRNVARAFDSREVPAGRFEATWQALLPAALPGGLRVLAFTERPRQAGITGASLVVPR